MPVIWFRPDLQISDLHELGKDTMGDFLGIRFLEIGDDYLTASMPVTQRTRQPYGILHGGASVVLAETLGSVASSMVINPEFKMSVGLEVNANHLRPVKEGIITGICTPIHLGATTHVWDIKLHDEKGRKTCISRLTVAIIDRRKF